VSEAKEIKTTCGICYAYCGVKVGLENGRAVTIEGTRTILGVRERYVPKAWPRWKPYTTPTA